MVIRLLFNRQLAKLPSNYRKMYDVLPSDRKRRVYKFYLDQCMPYVYIAILFLAWIMFGLLIVAINT